MTTTLKSVIDILDRSIEQILRSEDPTTVHAAAMKVVAAAQRALLNSPDPSLAADILVYEELLNEALNETAEFGPIREV